MPRVAIVSIYGPTIDAEIPILHREVVQKYNKNEYAYLPLCIPNIGKDPRITHGTCIDDFWNHNNDYDIVIFLDIDCIPLNEFAFEFIIEQAILGKVVGCSQISYIPFTKEISYNIEEFQYTNKIYAGSFCFGLSRETYNKIGRPSASFMYRSSIDSKKKYLKTIEMYAKTKSMIMIDTAEHYTLQAEENGVEVSIIKPIKCDYEFRKIFSKMDAENYGFGTVFGNDIYGEMFYHQFSIRIDPSEYDLEVGIDIRQSFINKCKEVLAN